MKFERMNVFDLVLVTVLAACLGVASWGWTFLYEFSKPVLQIFGIKYLLSGFWIIPCLLPAFIVRKPGAALLAGLVEAFVELLITNWGVTALMWGFVQGLGAEIVFLIFMYRNWNAFVVCLAGAVSAVFSYSLDFYYYDYINLNARLNLSQLLSFVFSAATIAGAATFFIVKKLKSTGVLNFYKIARESK